MNAIEVAEFCLDQPPSSYKGPVGAGLEKINLPREGSKPWHSAPVRSGLGIEKHAESDAVDRIRFGPPPVELYGAGGGRSRKN